MSTTKQGIRNLVDEFLSDYSDFDSFDYNFNENSFFIQVLKATQTPNHKDQKDLISFEDKLVSKELVKELNKNKRNTECQKKYCFYF